MDQGKVNPDKSFWDQRYQDADTGWDIGYANKALTQYVINTVHDKSKSILIPGAGRAYEVEYLWSLGYRNIYAMDISSIPKVEFLQRVPRFPEEQYVIGDFFEYKGSFDVILEQTFFCALNPALRPQYILKMKELLHPEGKLAGVLFSIAMDDGPPFGGTKEEYEKLFSSSLKICKLEECNYSIGPRAGKELFFECENSQSQR